MNNGIISKIIVLCAIVALGGCSSSPPQPEAKDAILSAADLQAMVQVTVTEY